MAGSWLKVEASTPRKIQVAKIAESLGISRMEAFCYCVEFWCWCDLELVDGRITGLSLDALDRAAGVPSGFSKAMLDVEWLSSDGTIITVMNWEHHLSSSAKARANGARRAAKYSDLKRRIIEQGRN